MMKPDLLSDEKSPKIIYHVLAACAIVFASAVGVILPIIATRSHNLKKTMNATVVRNFRILGTGSILSTAFVHLFASAFDDFQKISDPLNKFIVPLCGLICLIGVVIMMMLDFSMISYRLHNAPIKETKQQVSHVSKEIQPLYQQQKTLPPTDSPLAHNQVGCCGDSFIISKMLGTTNEEHDIESTAKTKRFGFYALEFGIAFHSVIVGVTLGLKQNSKFWSFFGAVVVHQFLEGFALGSIAAPMKLTKKATITLVSLFSFTTAIGGLLGAFLCHMFNLRNNDYYTLITRGTFSAISAGIMIYSTIVEAILPEIKDENFHKQGPLMQIVSGIFFLIGVGVMTIISYFA